LKATKKTSIKILRNIDTSSLTIDEISKLTGINYKTIYRTLKRHGLSFKKALKKSHKEAFLTPRSSILGLKPAPPDQQNNFIENVKLIVKKRADIELTDENIASIMGVGRGVVNRWKRNPNTSIFKRMTERKQKYLLYEIKERLERHKERINKK